MRAGLVAKWLQEGPPSPFHTESSWASRKWDGRHRETGPLFCLLIPPREGAERARSGPVVAAIRRSTGDLHWAFALAKDSES